MLKGDPAIVSRRLSHYDTAIRHAVTASMKPRLDFHRDWDDGHDILMPENGFNKQLVRALCLKAEAHAFLGDLNITISSLEAALRLSHLVSQEGEWTTISVRLTCENFVTESIARVAGLCKSSKEHLINLDQLLNKVDGRIDFRRAYRIHSYLTLAMLRNRKFGMMDMGEPIPGKRRTGLPTTMISKAFAAKFMTFQLREKPIVDKYGFDLERFSEARKELVESTWSQNAGSDAMNSILVPQMGLPNSAKLLLARKAVGKCLIQALLYRAESGKLPTSLSQIPGSHLDPFSTGDLKFIRTGEAIRIYSIGPNGVENGGYRQSETKATIAYDDIIATYSR